MTTIKQSSGGANGNAKAELIATSQRNLTLDTFAILDSASRTKQRWIESKLLDAFVIFTGNPRWFSSSAKECKLKFQAEHMIGWPSSCKDCNNNIVRNSKIRTGDLSFTPMIDDIMLVNQLS